MICALCLYHVSFCYLHCTRFHPIIRNTHIIAAEAISKVPINTPKADPTNMLGTANGFCARKMEVSMDEPNKKNIKAANEMNTPSFFLCNNNIAPITEGIAQMIDPPAIKKVIHTSITGVITRCCIYANTAMMLDVMIAGTTPLV